ncbi:MAG: glycoside hydrolase family 2 TIM barrel-domain containing protein [Bacteroidota bacterium]
MMRAALVLGLAALAMAAHAQPAGGVVEPPIVLDGRERVSLDGDWQYLVEPYGQALRNRNSRRDFPADRLAEGQELVEYEWDSAPTLAVPGDVNHQDPQLWLYEGPVWVRTRFDAPAHDGRVFLHFEAANYRTHVFLNDEKLGTHEGGYTGFAFEVTGRLRDADNSLVVAVDNSRRDDGIPARRTDWWNYGGITRSVSLALVPETFVQDLTVRFSDADGPRVAARVELDGPAAAGAPVTVSVPELDLRETVAADAFGVASVAFAPEAVRRWTLDDPHRYRIVVEAGGEALADAVGLRTVGVRGTEVLLNGEPVFLAGVALHEEAFDPQGRRAHSDADYRALLEAARSVGSNFVRLSHYPHGERMVQMADSMGFLIWSEVPVYWEDIDYADAGTLELARNMVEAMVDRDANRAGVVLWSVANETPQTEDRLAFLRTLIADVRRLDPTRLVTAALKSESVDAAAADGAGAGLGSTGRTNSGLVQRITDALAADLDVLAVNTYVGWYGTRTPPEIAGVTWESPWGKPVVMSEFGAGSVAGLRGPASERWTEEYHADLLDQTLAVASRTPFVAGASVWVLKDFRSPRRWHPRYQAFWNRKGLFSETGARKLGADVVARWYARLGAGERPDAPLGIAP